MNLVKMKVGEDIKLFTVKTLSVTLSKSWGIINLYFTEETSAVDGDMLELIVCKDKVDTLLDSLMKATVFDIDSFGEHIESATFYTHLTGYVRTDKLESISGKLYDRDMQLYALNDVKKEEITKTNTDKSLGSDEFSSYDVTPFRLYKRCGKGIFEDTDYEDVCVTCPYTDSKENCEGCLFNKGKSLEDAIEATLVKSDDEKDKDKNTAYSYSGEDKNNNRIVYDKSSTKEDKPPGFTVDTFNKFGRTVKEIDRSREIQSTEGGGGGAKIQPTDDDKELEVIPELNPCTELTDEELSNIELPWSTKGLVE